MKLWSWRLSYNRVLGCWRQEHRLSAKESFKHRSEPSQDRGCVCHLWQGEGLLKSTGAYIMATCTSHTEHRATRLNTFPVGSGPCFGSPHTHPAMPPFLPFGMGCLFCVVVYWKCKFFYFLGANSEKTAFGQDGTVKACGTLGWTNYILCYEMIISRLGPGLRYGLNLECYSTGSCFDSVFSSQSLSQERLWNLSKVGPSRQLWVMG